MDGDTNGNRPSSFRFIDLFAGIGGFRLGFERAGGECVFTSEWDKYCRQSYEANFGQQKHLAGDIRHVGVEDIPPFDILLAGFPCQPFSIAGVTKKRALGEPDGFADPKQGNLFFQITRILGYHRPRVFVLENVRNLKSHDQGRTFGVILDKLESDLRYKVSHRVIDARSWVPQHRERIVIVGVREGAAIDLRDLVIPNPKTGPRMRDVLHGPEDDVDGKFVIAPGKVNPKYILSEHLWTYLQGYARKHRSRGNGFGFGLVGPDDVSRTLSARYYKDGSEILVRRGRGRPRRLTPRECARLMGFRQAPDGLPWRIPVSDTQAYKQFGNAMVPDVAEAVARHILPRAELEAITTVARNDLALVHA